ncbi:MAG: ATP-binding protein [Salibacteraceae bacterium]|nr:ATP-binding protein [Salibacteraceae bacterium]
MNNLIKKLIDSGVDESLEALENSGLRTLNSIALFILLILVSTSGFTVLSVPDHLWFIGTVCLIEMLLLTSVLALNSVQRYLLAKQVFVFNTTFVILLLVGYYGIQSNFQYVAPISFMSLLFLFRNGTRVDFITVSINLGVCLLGVLGFYIADNAVVELKPQELASLRIAAYMAATLVTIFIGSVLFRSSRTSFESTLRDMQNLSAQARILNTISANVDEAFFKSNTARGFEFMNEAFPKMFGYESIDEMMRTNPKELFYNVEDRSAMIDKLKRERVIRNALLSFRKKDGMLFYGRLSCNMIVEKGQDRIVGIITDVTQQHQQDELLRQSESRLRESQRIAKLGNFRFDEQTMQVEWSEETFRIHGYPFSDFAPQMDELLDRFETLSIENLKIQFENTKLTAIPASFGGWYVTPLNERKYIQFEARYAETDDHLGYWVGTVQDISAAKVLEEELAGNTRFFETILNNAPLEIVLLDNNLKYAFVSEQAVVNPEIRKWLIGKTDLEYCKYSDQPLKLAEERQVHLLKCIETNSVVRWEEEVTDQYGRINYMFRNIAPINDPVDGKLYLAGFAFNVTRLKESQLSLEEKNAELHKVNQELDRFVYSISHDLRAPIASVLGLISLAEESDNIDEALSILSMQREALDRLDVYIRDVIDYSRNKRLMPVAETMSLERLVQASLNNLAYLPTISQIEFFHEYDAGDYVLSDQMRVQIIVNNLLSNAIKYLDTKKEHPYIRIATERKKDGLIIIVQDNGIGIKEQYLDRVWEMFYRGTSESNGSGLGLYILKESLQTLKGSVALETEDALGTKFTIYIPDLA